MVLVSDDWASRMISIDSRIFLHRNWIIIILIISFIYALALACINNKNIRQILRSMILIKCHMIQYKAIVLTSLPIAFSRTVFDALKTQSTAKCLMLIEFVVWNSIDCTMSRRVAFEYSERTQNSYRQYKNQM